MENRNRNRNENIIKGIIKGGFTKPTTIEVREYCKERNNKINAEEFHDFYESKGWMIGKNKMKDWKAAIRTWEKKQDSYPQDIHRLSTTPTQKTISPEETDAYLRSLHES